MTKRALIPGERHHWWPRSLSQFWIDDNGLISRVDTEGTVSRSTPTVSGRISDGHNIRFGGSPWDTTFEQDFDRPDSNFPSIVRRLETLAKCHRDNDPLPGQMAYCSHAVEDAFLESLCECLVSLAVRSPKFRQGILSGIEFVRSSVPKDEHKRLIAVNLRQTYSLITQNMLGCGKFLILFSDSNEFIFGDGFYHNLSSSSQYMFDCRILVPLTPILSILYVLPMEYLTEPRLVTQRANENIIAMVNETVQVYSKECLFYRFERPDLSDHFLKCEHLVYSDGDPVEVLISEIPGVRTRDEVLPF